MQKSAHIAEVPTKGTAVTFYVHPVHCNFCMNVLSITVIIACHLNHIRRPLWLATVRNYKTK